MRINIASGFIVILLFVCFANAQTLTVRNAHSMIYDSKSKKTFLFGGADEKRVYGDLWVLDKKRWKKISERGPSPRTFASFVYDKASRRAILFGGNRFLFGTEKKRAEMLGDTWELKKGKWRKLSFSKSPEPRAEAAIAYDPINQRIILFGGYTVKNGGTKRLGDTWEFRAGLWKKLSETGPTPRNGAAMAFDKRLKKIVLFGGSANSKNKYGEGTGETWVLENNVWRKMGNRQPENIFNSNMVYQSRSDQLFRFGGWDGKGRTNHTWVFSGSIWKKLNLKRKPAARNHASMVYDFRKKRTILFGGHNGEEIFGDLWIFKQGKWYKEFEHTPIKRINNGH